MSRYTLYVAYDEENDSFFETDSLYEILKEIWENRKEKFHVTWTKI